MQDNDRKKCLFLAEVYSDFQACHFSDTLGPDNNKCSYRWQLSQISSLKHFCYFIKGGPAQIPATFDLGCKACWWERRGETQIRIQYNTYWNANKQRNTNTSNVWLGMQSLLAELSFVTTIATGSRVKFVPAVEIFPKKRHVFFQICVDVQDLHSTSMILHWNCWNFTHSVQF